MRARWILLGVAWLATCDAVYARDASSPWFPVPASAAFETGDSWSDRGVIYRLYGVQACLRGTSFTNAHGVQHDCGEASLAMLVSLIRDLRPQCYQAAWVPQTRTSYVFCFATLTQGAGAGSRVDLGTALITTGFAFAALKADGSPVHPPYAVAEGVARQTRAGLWEFPDMPDPNRIIQRALHPDARRATGGPPGREGVP